nr:MAG TPA: hypothetical protein [Caudoviricetes sp.]
MGTSTYFYFQWFFNRFTRLLCSPSYYYYDL